jgi:hypothetical protein
VWRTRQACHLCTVHTSGFDRSQNTRAAVYGAFEGTDADGQFRSTAPR